MSYFWIKLGLVIGFVIICNLLIRKCLNRESVYHFDGRSWGSSGHFVSSKSLLPERSISSRYPSENIVNSTYSTLINKYSSHDVSNNKLMINDRQEQQLGVPTLKHEYSTNTTYQKATPTAPTSSTVEYKKTTPIVPSSSSLEYKKATITAPSSSYVDHKKTTTTASAPSFSSVEQKKSTSTTPSSSLVESKKATPVYKIPENILKLIKTDVIPQVLHKPLSPSTYKDFFASLLYAEDYYLQKWSEFCLLDVTLKLHRASIYEKPSRAKNSMQKGKKDDKLLVAFEIDSIPENRPFLLSRDYVFLVRRSRKKVHQFQVV